MKQRFCCSVPSALGLGARFLVRKSFFTQMSFKEEMRQMEKSKKKNINNSNNF